MSELFGVKKQLTTDDLIWACNVFQKVWRGRCSRLVVRRQKQKEMEQTLASSGASSLTKRWAVAKERPCWISLPYSKSICWDEEEADRLVTERCETMLRRATMNYYFTASQVTHLLQVVPVAAKVECLIALWGMVTDLENLHIDEILEGSDLEEPEEFVEARKAEFYQRVGIANCFNPCASLPLPLDSFCEPCRATSCGADECVAAADLPDGFYDLNLRHPGQRAVAQMLVQLSVDEPGENMLEETYNGTPFDVGQRWLEQVPDLGQFSTYYTTPPKTASLARRIELANRLLMPGPGRWRCIPRELVKPDELDNPDAFEIESWEETGMELDDDGLVHKPPKVSAAELLAASAGKK